MTMKPDWKTFITNKGADIKDNRVTDFGNAVRERKMVLSGDIFCDLSHLGLISVHGEDAAAFMQGQLTNDIMQVTAEHSQLSAYCNPKGRMLANFRVFRIDDTWYLRMPRSMVDQTLQRLHMFVLNAKVVLEDASDNFVRIGYSGPDSERQLGELTTVPANVDDCCHADDLHIIRVAGPHPRFEIYGEIESMKKLWERLDVFAAPVGEPCWAMLTILAGVPVIYPGTSAMFVPQMVNLTLVNGVNFKKGCYTGQEIVARMQYLGKLKRRMYLAQVNTSEDTPPKPGTQLFAQGSESGQGAGNIVNAQPWPDGGYIVLAVIEIASLDKGKVLVGDVEGPELHFMDLPYPFPSEGEVQQK
jgi:folate-binding protein YgfZ